MAIEMSLDEVSLVMEDYQNRIREAESMAEVYKDQPAEKAFFDARIVQLQARRDVLAEYNDERLEAMNRKQ